MESIKRIHHHSAPEDKIALFRSLFRGRDDVYPRRFEAAKQENRSTLRHARMNGSRVSAKSRKSSAWSALIELPIPFDGWGRMEVDLLCADARIAIELDGEQHLIGVDAYRRDRRKDSLLQENGYLVLRFLAEDVGKRLDEVLNAIIRALSHRTRRPPGSASAHLFKVL